MGNMLTGEDRDLITTKCTLDLGGATFTYPLTPKFAAEIGGHLDEGHRVIRAWQVLWPADGGKPVIVYDTGYIPDPEHVKAAERAEAARKQYPALDSATASRTETAEAER